MNELLQQLANGLVMSSLYLLLALGLSLVFGVLHIPHFAFGSVAVLGGYFGLVFINRMGFPIWISILLAIAISTAAGILLERLPYKNANELPPLNIFIISLGLMTFLNNTMQLIFGPDQFQVKLDAGGMIKLGPVMLTELRLILILTAISITVATAVILKKSKLGTAIRAVAENREAALLMGISIKGISAFVFGFASAVGALVGILYGGLYSLVPTRGNDLIFFGFAALVLAGMGNLMGTIISCLIIGIFQSLTIGYISSHYSTVAVFVMIILVLVFKPMGLFAKEVRR